MNSLQIRDFNKILHEINSYEGLCVDYTGPSTFLHKIIIYSHEAVKRARLSIDKNSSGINITCFLERESMRTYHVENEVSTFIKMNEWDDTKVISLILSCLVFLVCPNFIGRIKRLNTFNNRIHATLSSSKTTDNIGNFAQSILKIIYDECEKIKKQSIDKILDDARVIFNQLDKRGVKEETIVQLWREAVVKKVLNA